MPFTDDEKMQLTAKVLGQEQLALRAVSPGTEKAAPKRRVLSVSIPPDTEALAPLTKTHPRVAQVIVFDYNQNNATNLLVDANSAEVLAKTSIRGRPQPSIEEKRDAIDVIQRDPKLKELVHANAVIEGGFIVDAPRGSAPTHRYLQLQLLTPDRSRWQRSVVVDLTAGKIASAKARD